MWCTLFTGAAMTARPAFAATSTPSPTPVVIFQDDFRDTTLTQWQTVQNAQLGTPSAPCQWIDQPAKWEVIIERLVIQLTNPECITTLTPKALWWQSTQSYAVEFSWMFPTDVTQLRSMAVLWQNSQNYVELNVASNLFTLNKVMNGQPVQLSPNGFTYPLEAGKTYRVRVEVRPGLDISVIIDGVRQLVTADAGPNYAGDVTFGFRGRSLPAGITQSIFDDVIVTMLSPASSSETDLPVPLYKQSDPLWKFLEYDHATTWSDKPTIERWGCALTSMAMILRSYGMNVLPNGDGMTPATLNAWLVTQADGYVGAGALNWMAVTRLTRELSAKLGTPKLEYRRLAGQVSIAAAEILAGRPVILEIPGHFIVGKGVTKTATNNTDIIINDPAYAYTQLSRHAKPLNSVRAFQPSFTDLSNLLIVSPSDVNVQVRDTAGALVDSSQSDHVLTDPFGESTSPAATSSTSVTADGPVTRITEFAKPKAGQYFLSLQDADGQQDWPVTLYTYNKNGDVQTYQLPLTAAAGAVQTFIVTIDETSSSLAPAPAWHDVLTDLKTWYATGKLWDYNAFRNMKTLVNMAMTADRATQLSILEKLVQHVTSYEWFFTPPTYRALLQELSVLRSALTGYNTVP